MSFRVSERLVWLAVAAALALLALVLAPSGRMEGLTQADCEKRGKDFNGTKCVCKKGTGWDRNSKQCTSGAKTKATSQKASSSSSGSKESKKPSTGGSGSNSAVVKGGSDNETGITVYGEDGKRSIALGQVYKKKIWNLDDAMKEFPQDTVFGAVHEDHKNLMGKRIKLTTENGKTVTVRIVDYCAPSDYQGCNKNRRGTYGGKGFLIDIHKDFLSELGESGPINIGGNFEILDD